MSIRLWLVSSCLVLLVLGFGGIFLAAYFLQSTVFALFPAATAPEVSQVVRSLLIGQAVALVVFIGLLLIVLFAVLGRIIGRPLRGILRTVNAFTASGERVPLPPLSGSPKEIRELAVAFTGFFERTEEAHAHDVEVSRVKSDFISTAAHQLRTPLTGIRWALEALEQEPLTEGQKALVKSATDKSHELVAIVGTLLDISSIESGKYKYAFAPVDMQGLAGEVAADFGPLASASKVSLFFEKHEGTLPSVRADRERVKWILNNLIENAIRYTPAGGTVRITVDASAQRVNLRVRDTGIGIEPTDRGNIFERFYRAPNAIAKENGGNGLGLYIARTIATDHGGDLNFAANEDGPGTTFVLSLPIAA